MPALVERRAHLVAEDPGLHRAAARGRPSEICSSTSRGSSPEAERTAMPVAMRRLRPATRTMKNSSRLRGEDREVAGALEQRHVLVRGELEDALVELQPGDLAVEEAVAGQHVVLGVGRVVGAVGRPTKRPLAARGWWVRVSVADGAGDRDLADDARVGRGVGGGIALADRRATRRPRRSRVCRHGPILSGRGRTTACTARRPLTSASKPSRS